VGTENDTKGEEWMMQKSKSDEMKDDEQVSFMVRIHCISSKQDSQLD
jgi:hypothetical protein